MITLIYSKDEAMCRRGLSKVLKESCPNRDESNFIAFNMAVSSPSEVAEEAELLPLGYDKKTVVAENCSFLGKAKSKGKKDETLDKLSLYLSHPNPDIDLIFTLYEDDIDEKNPLIALIKENGKLMPLAVPSESEWGTTAKRFFEKNGIKIDDDALALFIKRVDYDYGSFLSEREKLLCFAETSKVITKADVKALLNAKPEDDVFALTGALSSGNIALAIKIYRDLKVLGMDEIRLIGMIANNLIFLDKVDYLSSKGMTKGEIARTINAKEGRVGFCLSNLRNTNGNAIKTNLDNLYKLDESILSGNIDPEVGFHLFLANYKVK